MSCQLLQRFLQFTLLLMAMLPLAASAEVKSRALSGWKSSDESSEKVLLHRGWTEFLQAWVIEHPSGINRVRYKAVTAAEKTKLDTYIDQLAAIDPRTLTRKEQFPYWVNMYNALTVQLVLDRYPVESIREIKSGWFSFGPWDLELVTIAGRPFTLNDIEHRILRPIWRDSRIHYAVNCASIGCPNLMTKAFTAENTEWMLNTGMRNYVNHPRGVSLENGVLTLSSIYQWYGDDFAKDGESLVMHLASHAQQPLKQQLLEYRGRIRFRYDWKLNKP